MVEQEIRVRNEDILLFQEGSMKKAEVFTTLEE
jgi:hypothetical protein